MFFCHLLTIKDFGSKKKLNYKFYSKFIYLLLIINADNLYTLSC